jgi:hypothetical protein
MRPKSAPTGGAEWVGGFPCRGQEAPQRALSGSFDEVGRTVKRPLARELLTLEAQTRVAESGLGVFSILGSRHKWHSGERLI